jgi:hypothetical protein
MNMILNRQKRQGRQESHFSDESTWRSEHPSLAGASGADAILYRIVHREDLI